MLYDVQQLFMQGSMDLLHVMREVGGGKGRHKSTELFYIEKQHLVVTKATSLSQFYTCYSGPMMS